MKKWALRYLLFPSSLLLLGCVTTMVPAPITPTASLSYQIGEVQSASVGDAFVRGTWGDGVDVFEVIRDFRPPPSRLFGGEGTLWPAGTLLAVVGAGPEDPPNELYLKPEGARYLVSIFPDGQIKRGWVDSTGSRPLQASWPTERFLQKSDKPLFSGDSGLRGELVYSGREGETIRVMYREYVGDFARPAFTQELRYDLGESYVIRFRILEIEVLEAGNSQIRFRVVSDGGAQWVGG